MDYANDASSVHYEFPSTSHIHKSMLLRGVKLPPPALDRTDIEVIKGKAQRSGRSYGGVPLGRNNYNRGGRGEPINYGSGHQAPRQERQGRGQYVPPSNRHSHQSSYGAPPPNWQPPPPGYPGFGIGMPPPPPPARVHGGDQYGGNQYGGNRGQDYGQGYGNHYGGPPPPPRGNYGGQQYRPPAGQDRQDYRSHGGDRGGYRGSRGYR